MILADEITCQIADPNAAKVELINCSTSLIDSAKGLELMWIAIGAIGAFGAMLITIFVARYAWKAWRTANDQIDLTRTIAVEQQRLPALTEFLTALHALVAVDSKVVDEAKLRSAASEARFKAEIWAISYDQLFRAGSLDKTISFIENEVIYTYELMDAAIEIGENGEEDDEGFWKVVESVGRTTQAEQIIRVATMRLHRGEIAEEFALQLIESARNVQFTKEKHDLPSL
ncbi:hypothetical protein CQ012_02390 [Arthrobacter sp. MYb214]|uniref:hypothetical protein n=1 Tax=Arthrobacter sp. MYb214 TaxID=1848596 RepID=UPI000CFAF58C|nr:hypothetical protein [Arthrobacter sp. MYb214]PRB78257.1 hypothetical protein CQ012_02390 [Arthrobacter sp. MYb214]